MTSHLMPLRIEFDVLIWMGTRPKRAECCPALCPGRREQAVNYGLYTRRDACEAGCAGSIEASLGLRTCGAGRGGAGFHGHEPAWRGDRGGRVDLPTLARSTVRTIPVPYWMDTMNTPRTVSPAAAVRTLAIAGMESARVAHCERCSQGAHAVWVLQIELAVCAELLDA